MQAGGGAPGEALGWGSLEADLRRGGQVLIQGLYLREEARKSNGNGWGRETGREEAH